MFVFCILLMLPAKEFPVSTPVEFSVFHLDKNLKAGMGGNLKSEVSNTDFQTVNRKASG